VVELTAALDKHDAERVAEGCDTVSDLLMRSCGEIFKDHIPKYADLKEKYEGEQKELQPLYSGDWEEVEDEIWDEEEWKDITPESGKVYYRVDWSKTGETTCLLKDGKWVPHERDEELGPDSYPTYFLMKKVPEHSLYGPDGKVKYYFIDDSTFIETLQLTEEIFKSWSRRPDHNYDYSSYVKAL